MSSGYLAEINWLGIISHFCDIAARHPEPIGWVVCVDRSLEPCHPSSAIITGLLTPLQTSDWLATGWASIKHQASKVGRCRSALDMV